MICAILATATVATSSTTLPEIHKSALVPADDYQVTVVITKAKIIEDRDFGSAEIYLKARIDSGSYLTTPIYADINDGDTIQLDWTVLDDVRSSFSIRIEIWESDDGYNEASNDFLGYVSYTRNPVRNVEGWYDAQDPVGGNYQVQAQVYIKETAVDVTGPELNSPADVQYTFGTVGNSISWTATDDNPGTYEITRDGSTIDTGSWKSGSPITVSIDGLAVGSYVYVITVRDDAGNEARDSVTVTVIEAEGAAPGTTTAAPSPGTGGSTTIDGTADAPLALTTTSLFTALLFVVGLLGLGAVLARRNRHAEGAPHEFAAKVLIICPYCGNKTEQGKTKCEHCGATL
ncbi:MAG: zinc ribbon domain-containing protein [Candidatus Thorarchaeota archaeon]